MSQKLFSLALVLCLFLSLPVFAGEVIVYTSHDQLYSEPVLQAFEKETNIEVKAVYDIEATKTTGIVNRLIAEQNRPRCDVFWNNEHSRTIVLKQKGLLEPYQSPLAQNIPPQFKDPEGYWTGFGARARIIIYNKNLVKPNNIPTSIFDFTQPAWKGQFTIANPLFGTTATHAAALFSLLGDEKAKAYFSSIKSNGVIISEGNSVVKDQVANGEIKAGLTDTDDANIAVLNNKPIGIIYPDQDGIGTLLIPNTVCLIKNSPNPENGKKLIDYLLSPEVESRLAFSESVQIPVRESVKKSASTKGLDEIKSMNVAYQEIADRTEDVAAFLQNQFLK